MLPERDRRVLRQIEQDLRAEDPGFLAGFPADRQDRSRQWRVIVLLADVTVVLMIAVGIFAADGWPVFWGLVCVAAMVQVHRVRNGRRRKTT
ncbi:DUF3040 domain-containing protein [Amycolatopsis sp., V23-08]|uniref:DUF3040 domain-containing protein n=1 Tax=Amycolatopsis heterodermiae TaxID=3110235 RepID=A0ABU5RHB7_9PSEU|nr:DUF3040 domain-containing protein [Amycolatopsis sp., V23-08]MEA5365240.1 DUF3040 domain-containing protein [Amycolatopsis sp., V23-08]